LSSARQMPGPSSASPSMPSRPLVSVVIPTRDRPGELTTCLAALASQTIADDLEVVVVDDGSVAPNSVAEAVSAHSFVRLVSQSHRGPAAARNAGFRHATGRFICFTDDDCVARPEWAEKLLEALVGGADVVAGRTVPANGASPIALAAEIVALAPSKSVPGHGSAFAPSNNIACRADVFERVSFDESYSSAAGEDRDWCARLLAEGYLMRSATEAVLAHRSDATFLAFVRQQIRYGRGAFRYRHGDRQRRRLGSPRFYLALMAGGFRQGMRVGLLLALAQILTALGYFLEQTTTFAERSVLPFDRKRSKRFRGEVQPPK
jgi:glycosyltransferase involved in cell wall biosynthesis